MSPHSSTPDGAIDPAAELRLLLDRARGGDQQACQLLFDRYAESIRKVVRRHLNQQVRKAYDSIDVTQDVWKSFFVRILHGHRFQTPEEFLRFMTSVARNKALNLNRQQVETDKRSLGHEVSLTHPGVAASLADTQPDPARRAADRDEFDGMLRNFSDSARTLLQAMRDGDSLDEAAQRLGVSVRTAQRFLEGCRRGLERARRQ